MKIIRNLSLILITCLSFSLITFAKSNDLNPKASDPFYPTQADMLNVSHSDTEISDKNFEKVCNKIIANFKPDKDFITAFNKDKAEFMKYRLTQKNLILPAFESSDGTAYGSNYGIYSHSYLIELNNEKLKSYKRSLDLYCLYNDFAQSEDACSPKRIESLFK